MLDEVLPLGASTITPRPGAVSDLLNMGSRIAPSSWEEFKTAAPSLGFEARLLDVRIKAVYVPMA
jgi:hypothetical protein